MSVAPLLTNNLDNSKQKMSNLLSPAPPPYSWSLLGKCEGPAPPPSSKISWSFDLTWNPVYRQCIRKCPFIHTGNTLGNASLDTLEIHTVTFSKVWRTMSLGLEKQSGSGPFSWQMFPSTSKRILSSKPNGVVACREKNLQHKWTFCAQSLWLRGVRTHSSITSFTLVKPLWYTDTHAHSHKYTHTHTHACTSTSV